MYRFAPEIENYTLYVDSFPTRLNVGRSMRSVSHNHFCDVIVDHRYVSILHVFPQRWHVPKQQTHTGATWDTSPLLRLYITHVATAQGPRNTQAAVHQRHVTCLHADCGPTPACCRPELQGQLLHGALLRGMQSIPEPRVHTAGRMLDMHDVIALCLALCFCQHVSLCVVCVCRKFF